MKYLVTLIVDASIRVEVEADSKQEAYDKALDNAFTPSICHQCSREIDLGDIIEPKNHLEYVDEIDE